ncbi:SCO7460 family lipoprotein [Streptomyces sp. NPDC058171]
MKWRRGWGAPVAVALAVLVSGCVTSSREDRGRAQELAEKVYPGELTVIGSRSLFPADDGSEVTFAVKGDPDAVVRLRVDDEKGTCDRRSACEPALRAARGKAEAEAGAWRALRREFARCDFDVLGVKPAGGTLTEPWIAAEVNDGNVDVLLLKIGTCLEQYGQLVPRQRPRPAATPSPGASPGAPRAAVPPATITVNIVDPSVVGDLPQGRKDRPTLVGKTSTELYAALSRRTYHAAAYRWADSGIEPRPEYARPVMPFEEKQEFLKAVHANVTGWLRPHEPDAVVSDYGGVWRLVEGRADRLEGYVRYCDEPRGKRPACAGDHTLHVTTDLSGRLVGEPVGTRKLRADGGPGGSSPAA